MEISELTVAQPRHASLKRRASGFLEFQGIIALISKLSEDWIKKQPIFNAKLDKRSRSGVPEFKKPIGSQYVSQAGNIANIPHDKSQPSLNRENLCNTLGTWGQFTIPKIRLRENVELATDIIRYPQYPQTLVSKEDL